MDKKEFTASNLIPERLLDIICILERDEKYHSYKIIRNKKTFSLIAKFGAKNEETTPLKNNASAQNTARSFFLSILSRSNFDHHLRCGGYQDKKQVSSEDKLCKSKRKLGKKVSSPHVSEVKSASQHSDKNQESSNVAQAEQPKLKKKKTPAQLARDSARRKAFWKRTKLARQLRAKNFAAHYAKLQDTKTLASPQFSMAGHPENSGACLDSTTVRTVARPKVTVVGQPVNSGTCLDTNSSVSATPLEFLDTIDSDDNDDDVSSVHVHSVCSTCKHPPKEGKNLMCCSHCQKTRYCSIQCQEKDWADIHRFACSVVGKQSDSVKT